VHQSHQNAKLFDYAMCVCDVAGAGRDEEAVEGDGGGSRRSPRNAGQGREVNGCGSRFEFISLQFSFFRDSDRVFCFFYGCLLRNGRKI
jgi:hypothetical protein